jgi:2-polyprenyl-3-methyl-5-hydroxy-6-metoxy-1,4-benzoquinol methylase
LLYLDPQPTWQELDSHYQSDYTAYTVQHLRGAPALPQLALSYGLQRRCRLILQLRQQGRLLDIGAATGGFLNAMRHHSGWELHGVEPVQSAAQLARDQLGLNILPTTLEQAHFSDGQFDVVTLWDVLEHLPDPHASLNEIYRVTAPGAWLVLQIPDVRSWEAKLWGRWWIGYDAPRHLYAFPKEALSALLRATGFELVQSLHLAGGYHTFTRSLAFWCSERPNSRARVTLLALTRSWIFRVLASPVFWAIRRLGKGPTVVVIARRVESKTPVTKDN